MSPKTKRAEALVGHYFHSWKDHEDGEKRIEWQGIILAEVTPGGPYLVQLFSWLVGDPIERRLVSLDTMLGWTFYEDQEAMAFAYSKYRPHERDGR